MIGLGYLLAAAVGLSLGFFGGGGSILTVPLLVYVFGLEPKPAIASSLLIVAVASAAAAVQHARAGNLRLRAGLAFGLAGMLGAYAGGRASVFVDGGVLLLLFACMMLLTSLAMWRGRRGRLPVAGAGVALHKLMLQGLVVGSFTGLIGAGGGFLIVPALVLWAGLPMAAAVGTSLFVIVLNSAAGFAGYVSHVRVDPLLVASISACAVIGSGLGLQLARRTDPAALRRGFAVFVLLMAALILVREGSAVAETARLSLPRTLPQLFFALAMLAVGIFAGRASDPLRRAGVDASFHEGAGI
jgi:uncharacterized protein